MPFRLKASEHFQFLHTRLDMKWACNSLHLPTIHWPSWFLLHISPQINDKGQLRLSRRALLPDTSANKADTATQSTESDSESSDASTIGMDTFKRIQLTSKDGSGDSQQSKRKTSPSRGSVSSKRGSTENNASSQKVFRKSAGSETTDSNKGEPDNIIVGADESKLVNGEAKVA